jgi:Protein of unknown function (DUF3108)
MYRAVSLTLLLYLVPFSLPPNAAAAELNYTLYVLGLPVADAVVTVDMALPAYRMSLGFHTTGLIDIVASDNMVEHTSGRFEGDRPAPAEYGAIGRRHGQTRDVRLTWRDGTLVVDHIIPPNSTEREDVPAAQLAHAVNPLDAFALLLNNVARTGRCEGSSRAYDGRRLQLLEATTAGDEDIPPSGRSSFSGRALRCDFTDRTLAGFLLGSGHDDDAKEHRGTLWLAQISPGSRKLPVRASIETRWFGDATIYLTSSSP